MKTTGTMARWEREVAKGNSVAIERIARRNRFIGEEATILPAKEYAVMRAKWDAMTADDFADCEEAPPARVVAVVEAGR